MTREEIFEKVYDYFVSEFVFRIPEEVKKSEEGRLVKEKLYTLILSSAEVYNRKGLTEFRKREEIMKETVFQTIVILTFFMTLFPYLLIPQQNFIALDDKKILQ